jgi:Flp pilus assembly protein TadD
MPQMGDLCCRFALDCESAATKKAEERNLPACTVPTIRHLLKKSEALSHLYQGNVQQAYRLALDSVAVAVSDTDIINGNLCAAKCAGFLAASDNVDNKIKNYSSALKEMEKTNTFDAIPLMDYVEAGKALITTGRFEDALDVMLLGCRVYPSSTLFHLVGVCCLRLDRMVDAEDALLEANLIDHRNPEVWAYLTILCLATGDHRLEEAERSCQQALRLGLQSSAILREIAMAFIAVDKLRTAEELIRRSMACDAAEGAKPNSHTRRLLGDILAGQNQAAEAIEEYQIVIGDEEADIESRLAAGEKCSDLLSSLGRTEELNTLDSIMETLSGRA